MSNIQHDATHAPAGMTFFATSDITALTKGRALLTRNVTEGSTIGWVPANLVHSAHFVHKVHPVHLVPGRPPHFRGSPPS